MSAITMEQEQELSITQVAYRLNVSEMTIRRRIEAGLLQARKEGREWRISISELERYIRSTHSSEMRAIHPEEEAG